MLSALPLWLHLVAAATWVGSQVMMVVVVIPSVRLAENALARHQMLRGITARFGYLGAGALLVLVLTGLENLNRYAPVDMFDYRYGYVLAVKLVMVLTVVVLTVYHAYAIGPKLLDLQARNLTTNEPVNPADIRALRVRSIVSSSAVLILSLAILFCAALLRNPFSYEPV